MRELMLPSKGSGTTAASRNHFSVELKREIIVPYQEAFQKSIFLILSLKKLNENQKVGKPLKG